MRLYLDTMEWIYHFENNADFGPAATALVDRMDRGNHTPISSLFVLSEILIVPRRDENEFAIAKLAASFFHPPLLLLPIP